MFVSMVTTRGGFAGRQVCEFFGVFCEGKKKHKMAMTVSRPQPVGPTIIGAAPWRDSTMSGIKDNNKVIGRSDETVKFGRSVDPLPHLRFMTFFYDRNFVIMVKVKSNSATPDC